MVVVIVPIEALDSWLLDLDKHYPITSKKE